MKSFGETLSGRVEKIKGLLGIKAKKIVEEQSKQIVDVFSSPIESIAPTADIPQASDSMEVVHSSNDLLKNEVSAERHDSSQEPTSMAA